RGLGSPVRNRKPDEDVFGTRLGVLGENVEVPPLLEHPGVGELELAIIPAPAAILGHQLVVRERGLRVLVERLEVGVRGRRVEVVVALFHLLAVVAFWTGETEEPFLEDRIAAIPERQPEAEPALPVGDAEETILAPTVDPAARMVVREVVPAIAVGGVVL